MDRGGYRLLGSSFDDYDFTDVRSGPRRAYCKRCGDVLDDWYPRNLEASLSRPFHAVHLRTEAALVHADVWRQIAHHCPSAVIGPVTVRDGDLDRFTLDWVTVLFPPEDKVHARGRPARPGSAGVPMHVCELCNRQKYASVGEPEYLVRSQIPNRAVFMDHNNYLIMVEPVAEEVDWSEFLDVEFVHLSVRDKPIDGVRLLGDPDWDSPSE